MQVVVGCTEAKPEEKRHDLDHEAISLDAPSAGSWLAALRPRFHGLRATPPIDQDPRSWLAGDSPLPEPDGATHLTCEGP